MICDSDKQKILNLFYSGQKITRIAEILKIKRVYIYRFFKKNNIKYDIKNRFPLELIKTELKSGSSIKAFCKKYKISRRKFLVLCNQYGYNYSIDYKHIKKTTSKGELSGFAKLLTAYKRNAKKRNIQYELSDLEFMVLVKQNCFYCNSIPSAISKTSSKHSTFIYNGIDRVDNSIGYIKTNIVTCCKLCNQAKSTLTLKEFKNFIESVYNNFIKGKK